MAIRSSFRGLDYWVVFMKALRTPRLGHSRSVITVMLINGMLPAGLSGRNKLLSGVQVFGRRVPRNDVRFVREGSQALHVW